MVRVSGVKQQMLTGRQTLTENWERPTGVWVRRARRGSCQDAGVLGRGLGALEDGEDSFSERAMGGLRHPHLPQTSLVLCPLLPALAQDTCPQGLAPAPGNLQPREDSEGKRRALLLPEERDGQAGI